MNLRGEDHQAVRDWIDSIRGDGAAPAGRERLLTSAGSFGAGGPLFSDGFRTKAAPSPDRLIDAFRGVAYSCARLNANGVSRTPLRLYVTTARHEPRPRCLARPTTAAARARLERLPYAAVTLARGIETGLDEVVDHPILTLLRTVNRSPDNPFAGLQSLLYYLELCKELTGQAYWKFDRDGLDVPSQLWPLDPRTRPIPFASPRADGRVIDHYVDPFGEEMAPETIARFRFLSPRNPYVASMGPTEAAYQQLGVRDKFEASVEALLANAFHPSAIVSAKNPDRPIGEDVKPRLESDLAKKFSRGRSGGVVIADGAIEYHPWEQPPTDTGGLEVSKEAKETIANCYDVPMTLLSMQTSNRASAEAGNYAHAVNGVAPRCEQLGEELTAWVRRLDAAGSLNWGRLILAFDNPVPEDEEREMKVQVGYVKAKVKLPDEVREELGYGPRPDGKGMEPVEAGRPADAKGEGAKHPATDEDDE